MHAWRRRQQRTDPDRQARKFVIEVQYATGGSCWGRQWIQAAGCGRRRTAGLAAAEYLRREGHAVTVYDANPHPGGLLIYGIPAFKLNKQRVIRKVEQLRALGIAFVQNTRVGKDVTLTELCEQYDAVFVGVGANVDVPAKWEGVDLVGVYQAGEFLIRANVPTELQPEPLRAQGAPAVGRRVYVFGGGDTAMDCVRSALRLQYAQGFPLDVTCAYRRTEAEMPGSKTERVNAREEGAQFRWLTAPVRFLGDEDGRLRAIELIEMTLGEPDASGRRRPVPLEGSEHVVEADTAILALGYWPDRCSARRPEPRERLGLIEAVPIRRTRRSTSGRRAIASSLDRQHGDPRCAACCGYPPYAERSVRCLCCNKRCRAERFAAV